jgi:hypothetical protein
MTLTAVFYDKARSAAGYASGVIAEAHSPTLDVPTPDGPRRAGERWRMRLENLHLRGFNLERAFEYRFELHVNAKLRKGVWYLE